MNTQSRNMKTMKKIQVLVVFGSSLFGSQITAQTSIDNYIKAEKATTAIKGGADLPLLDVTQVNTSIGYHDGLGRPLQTITYQGSPQKNDVVQPFLFDKYGRQTKKYLPLTTGNNGALKQDSHGVISPYVLSLQNNYYNGGAAKTAVDTRPFSEAILESSSLNRPIQQFGPGQNWKDNNRSVNHQFLTNAAGEVYFFLYDSNSGLVSLGTGPLAFYAADQLTATKTIDENQNEIIEYADKLGRMVCKKVQYGSDSSGKLYASTYYIYDVQGNLVVVLPPEAAKSLTQQ